MSALRRLPWDGPDGKSAFLVSDDPHGLMSVLADQAEAHALETAQRDVERALALTDDDAVSRAELRLAVRWLAHAVDAAVNVAELRGERLDDGTD
ncbi:hypothetical protein ACFUCH_13520 [Streptomyces olivaceus]|uniref:hypothetical protein n=1 Tax=Streptomyces olivaceus TaxID=47716 RepID=UPI00362D3BE1